jgi:DNA repair protein RecO (recombination protein O)
MPSRERVYRTEAVVLRRQDLGEADRLLSVYSLDFGKLRLIAKGVRRPGSRKSGHLEPFTRVQLLLARGRELDIITQAEAIETFPKLRDDLVRLGQAAYVIELIDRFTLDRDSNQALYRLLIHTLERLAAQSKSAGAILHFQLRLLEKVGYRPEVFRCVGCGEELRPQDQYFSMNEGGVLCPDCGTDRREVLRIPLRVLKVLRHYQRSSYKTASSAQVCSQDFADLEQLMEHYFSYLLERKLNTPAFLRHIAHLTQIQPKMGNKLKPREEG